MAIKTIHHFEPEIVINGKTGFDRYTHPNPTWRSKLTELVRLGELPRYRGPEVTVSTTETETTVSYSMVTEQGAKDWADWFNEVIAPDSPEGFKRYAEVVVD